jgi:scytalone dehydratase
MPADDFVAMASDPKVLGDKTLMTQHFQGASKWEKVSDNEIIGYHQLRVPHQKYTDETRKTVAVKGTTLETPRQMSMANYWTGHAHSSNTHWYKKDKDGVWKFAGLCPDIRWFEYDFDKVFASGREELGEKEKEEEGAKLAQQAEGIPPKK